MATYVQSLRADKNLDFPSSVCLVCCLLISLCVDGRLKYIFDFFFFNFNSIFFQEVAIQVVRLLRFLSLELLYDSCKPPDDARESSVLLAAMEPMGMGSSDRS